MKIVFDKRKIETISTLLVCCVSIILTVLCIIALADWIFDWDLFSPFIEKVVTLSMASLGLILLMSLFMSLVLNLSIISIFLEKLFALRETSDDHDDDHTN